MKFTKKIINITFKEIFLKKRRRLFISLGILASVAIAAVLMLFFGGKNALAAWFDESFGYRQRVDITNSGTAQTDYQVAITLNTAALITAGKMQSDCDDIRITDANGKLLPHWIEESNPGCNQTTTKIWTKVPSISTSGTTIYLYYGNPSASNVESPTRVFVFYDNFSSDLSRWTNPTSCAGTISSGVLQISASTGCDSTPMYVTSLTQSDASGYAMDFRGKFSSGGSGRLQTYQRYRSTNTHMARFWISGTATNYQEANPGFGANTDVGNSNMSADTWYNLSAKVAGTNNTWIVNGTTIGSNVTTAATLITQTDLTVGLGQYQTTVQYDNVRVRKSATTEPSVASPTNEEKSPAPVAYWKFDEGYGTTARDSTQNSQNFTSFTGSPAWQTEDMCITGKCLRFPTRDDFTSFTVSSTSPLNLGASNFTISTWQKVFQPVTYGSGIMGRYPHSTSYNGNWSTGISDDLTTYFFYHRDMSGALQAFTIDYSSYFGKWTHIEWVKSGSTMYLYINGKLKQQWTITITFDVSFSGVPFYLSQTGWAPGTMANLTIDDLKIYAYARTAAQIKSDYRSLGTTKGAAAVLSSSKDQGDFLSQGLIGYWKMDEAASPAVDSSGNGNNATWQNSPSATSGKYGSAISLGGSNQYLLASNAATSIAGTKNLTISFWVKNNSPNAWSDPISFGDTHFRFEISGTNTNMDMFNTGIEQSGGFSLCTSCLSNSSWTHIVFTSNDSSWTTYVNGVATHTGPTVGTANMTNDLYIGRRGATIGSYYTGSLDEVRIYNRALSPNEVSRLYNWAPGPVGYWNFDEKTGATANDTSGNGNSGTWGGTGSRWTTGKFGSAGSFNGSSDYLNAGSGSTLRPTYAVSFGGWLKWNTFYSDAAGHGIVTYSDGASSNGYILIQSTGSPYNTARTCIKTSAVTCLNTLTQLNTSQWYHVFVVYDGSTIKIYLNGVLDNSTSQTGNIDWTGITTTFLVGSTYTTGGSKFNGSTDDVKVYNYARTQKQIVEDMNAGHPAPGSPIGSAVGYWKMDEGYGTTTQDSSTNDLDTTISGASWTNQGKFNKGLSLDGVDDYIYKTDNDALDLRTGGFTASAWINVQASASVHDVIIQKGATSNPDPGYWFSVQSSGYLDLYINDGGTYIVYALSSNKSVTDSQWHYVAFTWDPAVGAKIYIDGKLDNSASATSSTDINHSGQINIGGYPSSTFTLNGKLDEVKIYNSALTEDQIKLDYNRGAALVMGATSTDSSGNPDNSSTREYCIPGSIDTCIAPAGEWNFEEGTGGSVNDSSGNGNMGTWQGTLGNQWTNGKIGKAGKFNGDNNYVTITDNDTLDFGTGDFSISAWIKHSATLGSSYDAFILGKWGASAGYLFSVRTWSDAPGKLSFALRDNGTTWVEGKSNTAINDNTWHHVTVTTSRSGNATFYLDGKPDGSFSISSQQGNLNNNIDPLIGYGNSYFNGQIDQVRAYNYARTPAQIAWDYNRGGPVGHWKFDECQGAAANDSSGNGNSGTITEPGSGSNVGIGTCTGSSATMWKDGATGKFNSSLEFDGTDDYVNVGSYSSLNSIGDNISVSAWVKTSVNNTFQTIVGRGNDWRLWKNNSYYGFEHRNASNGIVTPQYSNTSTDWVHVVGTYQKDGYVKLYLNGILVDSDAQTGATRTSQTQNQIGNNYAWHGDGTYNDYWFNGQIDEVKIFNYTLTQQQIRDVYTGGAVRFGPSTGSP